MIWPLLTKDLKSRLAAELGGQLVPKLQTLGFQPIRKKTSPYAVFPTQWYRKAAGGADTIWFQWDKYDRPKFIINFNVAEDCESKPPYSLKKGAAPAVFRYRARAWPGPLERWFGIGLVFGALFPARAARRTLESVARRIEELDRFARTGTPSPSFYDGAELRRAQPRRNRKSS